MRKLILYVLLLFPQWALAEEWKVKFVSGDLYPADIVEENRKPVQNGLPDGLIANAIGRGDVLSAWYEDPTTRYGHGILGDAIEAGRLAVERADGEIVRYDLDKQTVFEDRYPRVKDLDGDGKMEIITIKASLTDGAGVTIYGIENGEVVERATSGYHGRANRWLNIAGIANFTGGEGQQVAFVRTPHIGGNLHFYRYDNGNFEEIDRISGFSNHVIGSREMRLSAIADMDGNGFVDVAVPSNDRSVLRMIGFQNGKLVEIDRVKVPSRINKAIASRGGGEDLMFTVGTSDGKVFEITRDY